MTLLWVGEQAWQVCLTTALVDCKLPPTQRLLLFFQLLHQLKLPGLAQSTARQTTSPRRTSAVQTNTLSSQLRTSL